MRLTEMESILMECDKYLEFLENWIDTREEELVQMKKAYRGLNKVVNKLEGMCEELEVLPF